MSDILSTIGASDLTASQADALHEIEKLPTTAAVRLIRVNTLLLKEAPQFKITLMGYSTTLIRNAIQPSNGTFQWTGQIVEQPPGSTVIIVNGEFVTASIQAPDGLYRIRPVGGLVHVLIKVGQSPFPPDHPSGRN
jgi:hypothetical protein